MQIKHLAQTLINRMAEWTCMEAAGFFLTTWTEWSSTGGGAPGSIKL
jgi:hypothetical protein